MPRKMRTVWKVGARVRAAAFLTAQGGHHDHQADDRGVACSVLRDRKRIERAGGCAQTFAIAQYAGGPGQDRKRRPRPIRKDLEGRIATRWRHGLQIR